MPEEREHAMQPCLGYHPQMVSSVISGVGKVLAALPVVRAIPGRYMHGMKIVSPAGTDVIPKGKICVRGAYSLAPTGDWVVFTQSSSRIWPQSDVLFNGLDRTWSAEVYIGSNANSPATIVLGCVSPEFRYLIEHYRRVGQEHHLWNGLPIPYPPQGIRIVARVDVTVGG